ncbi:MAG: hypothetical protein HYW45_02500 [Candidatus Daviesbacteria bacterium]|nr:MAG: hypothetical protein HYW45_02500 [Candidatus Daviesbacteria bacterium]
MPSFFKRPVLIAALIALGVGIFLSYRINLFPPLPQREVVITPPPTEPKPIVLQQGPFKCPSTESFCQKGAAVKKGDPLYAVFDGQMSTVTSTLPAEYNNEKITTIYLDNEERGLRAVYYVQGEIADTNPKAVEEGEKIGSAGEKMTYYQASLVFSIIKNYPEGEKLALTQKDFK